MANPVGLDTGDWIGLIVTCLIAGAGGAMAFFRRGTQKLNDRIDLVEEDMKEWDKLHAEHNTQLAVVKTCQENTQERLEQIDETTRDTNQSIKDLSNTLTQVLLAIQNKP